MDEQQVSACLQPFDAALAQVEEIGHREIVANLRKQDEIEVALRKVSRQIAAFQVEVRETRATSLRLRQSGFVDVDRQEPLAAGRELLGQHANGAACFEGVAVEGVRQRGQCGLVLGRLVRTRREIPGIGIGPINVLEVSGGQ
jgi:hypothetical protein